MSFRSSTALALALMLGGVATGVVATQPAAAAEKKGQTVKLSEGVRKPLGAAQTALGAKDAAKALESIAAAKAAIVTPEDRYWVSNITLQVGQLAQDQKLQLEGVEGMLESGLVDAANQPKFYLAAGQLALQTGDYPRAEGLLDKSLATGSVREAYAVNAEVKYKLKKTPEAVALITKAALQGEAAGTPIPEDWIKRGIAFAADGKLGAEAANLSRIWLRDYPSQVNWRDSLEVYRMLHNLDGDYNLDLMRLQRAAGALRGERDYAEYAEVTYIKFPNEAKSVIDQGIAAKTLDPSKSRGITEMRNIANGRLAADKASLSKTVANGRAALGMADAYASYGDYASATELYRKALTLGGVDANVVKTRLGAALALSNQGDEAKKVLAEVTGPRSDLAAFWTIFIDKPLAAPAPAAN